jgi:hypothetical protein
VVSARGDGLFQVFYGVEHGTRRRKTTKGGGLAPRSLRRNIENERRTLNTPIRSA